MKSDNYKIIKIKNKDTHYWLLNKHYAKKIPSLINCFGLFEKGKIEGVCCYGSSACPRNNNMGKFKQIELVRLVINENLEKNILSYFVGNTLKLLTQPISIISYSDNYMNHHGYIYQATNWIYTGISNGVAKWEDMNGKLIHDRTINELKQKNKKSTLTTTELANKFNIQKSIGSSKHRYFYFVGNKRDKRIWLNELKKRYKILPYPKGKNNRYDMKKDTIQSTDILNF